VSDLRLRLPVGRPAIDRKKPPAPPDARVWPLLIARGLHDTPRHLPPDSQGPSQLRSQGYEPVEPSSRQSRRVPDLLPDLGVRVSPVPWWPGRVTGFCRVWFQVLFALRRHFRREIHVAACERGGCEGHRRDLNRGPAHYEILPPRPRLSTPVHFAGQRRFGVREHPPECVRIRRLGLSNGSTATGCCSHPGVCWGGGCRRHDDAAQAARRGRVHLPDPAGRRR